MGHIYILATGSTFFTSREIFIQSDILPMNNGNWWFINDTSFKTNPGADRVGKQTSCFLNHGHNLTCQHITDRRHIINFILYRIPYIKYWFPFWSSSFHHISYGVEREIVEQAISSEYISYDKNFVLPSAFSKPWYQMRVGTAEADGCWMKVHLCLSTGTVTSHMLSKGTQGRLIVTCYHKLH